MLTIVGATKLSDLFSSFIGDDIKNSDGSFELTPDQLSSFINQFQQNQAAAAQKAKAANNNNNNNANDHSSVKGKANRRKVLFDLSIRDHYEKRLHEQLQNRESITDEDVTTTDTYEYFNEGMQHSKLLDTQELKKNDGSIFSRGSHWTYRWRPRKSLSQIHLEPSTIRNSDEDGVDAISGSEILKLPPGSILSSSIQFVIPTVHDLGTYLPPETPDYESHISAAWGRKEVKASIPQGMVIEYYLGGDTCKGSKKRHSKVIYDAECCERRQHSMLEEVFQNDGNIMIRESSEPEPCRYVLKACNICPANAEGEGGENETVDESSSSSSSSSIVDPSDFEHLIETYLQGTSTTGLPPMPPSQIEANKQLLQSMFIHAYDSYFYNAFPASELKPLTCEPGTFNLVRIPALTLIDTLDTFVIMGNYTEFARSVERLRYLNERMKEEFQLAQGGKSKELKRKGEEGGLFSVNQNVSVFETTIRVLGGLLSAHQMAVAFMANVVTKSDVWGTHGEILNSTSSIQHVGGAGKSEPFDDDNHIHSQCQWESSGTAKTKGMTPAWEYDGFLLELAHDIGQRLLFAFDTETGVSIYLFACTFSLIYTSHCHPLIKSFDGIQIPYGTVNLLYGVPKGETPVASLAGAGTLTLEFELLSRLTSDQSFGKAAKLATRALWVRGSELHLYGKHIDTQSGAWKEYLSGVGSNSDSFYEYLIKHYLLFPDDDDFWSMFVRAYSGMNDNSRIGNWYVDVDLNHGLNGHVRQVFESLMAFYPGLQVLLGEIVPSAESLNSFFLIREYLGLLPERFNFVHWKTEGAGDVHPLRPELVESCYFMHLATIGLHGSDRGPCSNTNSTQHTSSWLWAADFALHAVHKLSWTPCGFATVTKVGPTTTGGLDFVGGAYRDPQSEQKQYKIQHHNEMPSYFLTETIKYLYLTFDAEDNILHNDDKREWIFTTEAHPIHYVPVSNSSVQADDRIKNQLDQVRALLKERVSSKPDNDVTEDDRATKENTAPSFEHEQWSTKTPEQVYAAALHHRNNEIIASKQGISGTNHDFATGPPFQGMLSSDEDTHGIFSSEVSAINQAHYQFDRRGKGSGNALSKLCPNIHHPDLQWNMALHGDSMDYNPAHISSLSDDSHQNDGVDERMRTALASACFYGTDYYAQGLITDRSNSCANSDAPKSTTNKAKPTSTKNKQMHPTTSAPIPGATRYDMGPPLGAFDVSSFGNGDGFIVRQVDKNERLEVSIFHNEDAKESGDVDAVILVVITTPPQRNPFPEASHGKHSQTVAFRSLDLKGDKKAVDDSTITAKNDEDDVYKRHVMGELYIYIYLPNVHLP